MRIPSIKLRHGPKTNRACFESFVVNVMANMCYRVGIEAFNLDPSGRLEGREVRRLMRVHKVTIRELSARMQITMKRIREIRELGLDDRHSIRDWIEGITREDPGAIPILRWLHGETRGCLDLARLLGSRRPAQEDDTAAYPSPYARYFRNLEAGSSSV